MYVCQVDGSAFRTDPVLAMTIVGTDCRMPVFPKAVHTFFDSRIQMIKQQSQTFQTARGKPAALILFGHPLSIRKESARFRTMAGE